MLPSQHEQHPAAERADDHHKHPSHFYAQGSSLPRDLFCSCLERRDGSSVRLHRLQHEQMAEWLRGFASRIDLGRHGRSFLLQSTPDSIKIATQSTHRAATEHA